MRMYHPSPVNVIPIFCGMFCFLEVFSGGFGMVGLVIVGVCVGVCVCVCVCVCVYVVSVLCVQSL